MYLIEAKVDWSFLREAGHMGGLRCSIHYDSAKKILAHNRRFHCFDYTRVPLKPQLWHTIERQRREGREIGNSVCTKRESE